MPTVCIPGDTFFVYYFSFSQSLHFILLNGDPGLTLRIYIARPDKYTLSSEFDSLVGAGPVSLANLW